VHNLDWLAYLIPLAALVIGGISRIARAIQPAQAPPDGQGAAPAPAPPIIRPAALPPRPQMAAPPLLPPLRRPLPSTPVVLPLASLPSLGQPLPTARPFLAALFSDPDHARRAIILAEVLGPPVALRTTSPTRNAF
jgi:hypothetical protein